jgi:hypothetical protein
MREGDGRIIEMPCYGVFIRVSLEYFPKNAKPFDFSIAKDAVSDQSQDIDTLLSPLGLHLYNLFTRFFGGKDNK